MGGLYKRRGNGNRLEEVLQCSYGRGSHEGPCLLPSSSSSVILI